MQVYARQNRGVIKCWLIVCSVKLCNRRGGIANKCRWLKNVSGPMKRMLGANICSCHCK